MIDIRWCKKIRHCSRSRVRRATVVLTSEASICSMLTLNTLYSVSISLESNSMEVELAIWHAWLGSTSRPCLCNGPDLPSPRSTMELALGRCEYLHDLLLFRGYLASGPFGTAPSSTFTLNFSAESYQTGKITQLHAGI